MLIHLTRKSKKFHKTLAALISFLQQQEDLQPVVITDSLTRQFPKPFTCFAKRQTAQDVAAAETQHALAAAGLSPLRINHNGEPMRFCALLNRADIIITTKLHVGIVGTALRKFVISLPQHPKISRFYKQLKLEDRCLKEEDFTPERFTQLLTQGTNSPKTDWTQLETLIKTMPYKGTIQELLTKNNV